MRASSLCFSGLFVAAVLQGCSGDSFEPGTSASGGGKAGGANAGASGAEAGTSGRDGGAGTSAAAGSGGAEANAGSGGTESKAGSGGADAGGKSGAEAGGKGGAEAGGTDGGGAGGANLGGKSGGAGTAAGNAGSGGLSGGASGAAAGGASGVAGGGGAPSCVREATCGDGSIEGLSDCDITSCADAYCSSQCKRTSAAETFRATELCVQGVCWMFVDDENMARNGSSQATGSCAKLKADGRVWSLAWFTSVAERNSLLAAATQFLPKDGKNTAWIAPFYDGKAPGWKQPEAPVSAGPPPMEKPASGTDPLATKVQRVSTNASVIVTSDPSAGTARVICRANE